MNSCTTYNVPFYYIDKRERERKKSLPPTPGFEHTHLDSDTVVEVKVMPDSDMTGSDSAIHMSTH